MWQRPLLCVLILCATFCGAQNTCDQLVPKALELYGANESLRHFPAQMQAQMEQRMDQDKSLNAADRAKLVAAIQGSMNVERLIKNVENSVTAGCNPAEMQQVLVQLNTPLFQKMRTLEAVSSSTEGAAKLQQYAALPEVKSPPAKRAALISELVYVSGAADTMIDTVIETARALQEGIGAPAPPAEQLSQLRSQVQANAKTQMNQLLLAVYHQATDDELEKYIAALRTRPFQNFNRQVSSATVKGFGEETRHVGLALKQMLDHTETERQQP
jgi:hypothetical protein